MSFPKEKNEVHILGMHCNAVGETVAARLSAASLKFAGLFNPRIHQCLEIKQQPTGHKGSRKKHGFVIKEKLSRKVGID